MARRNGLIMIWALAATAVAALLCVAVLFCFQALTAREEAAELEGDMTLIAQDAMEREKYNLRFSASEPSLSGEVERNGRHYDVRLEIGGLTLEGLPMRQLTCQVTHASGRSVTLTTLVEGEEEG